MEKLLVFMMMMLATCCATPQDLSGKVFVFPKETATDHVKLLTTKKEFLSLTVCMRFKTDLSRNYGLISISTDSFPDAFTLFKPGGDNTLEVTATDRATNFLALSFPPNEWHSICATWNPLNGLGQLWIDGKPSIKRFITYVSINKNLITILGQEQDSHGGDFDANQSFIGMITELHMWDYVLPNAEINNYMEDIQFTPGNVFNWRALEYEITGDIYVENL